MSKLFGILAIVLGMWVGAEVLNKGVDQAFGGLFTGFSQTVATGEDGKIDSRSVPVRAAERYRAGFDRGIERVEKALGEE